MDIIEEEERGYKLESIDPQLLEPNPWNPNVVDVDGMHRIEASVDRNGIFDPIKIRQVDDGIYQILNGEHRVEIFKQRGLSKVPVLNFGYISDRKAKDISVADNDGYGSNDLAKLKPLILEIQEETGDIDFLPYGLNELDDILSTVDSFNLDELGIDDEDDPIGADMPRSIQSHQVMRFKVPIDDAETVTRSVEAVIKANNLNESDSLTNAGDALMIIINKYLSGIAND